MAGDKIKIAATIAIITGIIAGGLYLVSMSAKKEKAGRLEHIEKGYGYTTGIITEIISYKGHSITVEYKINGKEYETTIGWDYNTERLGVGDAIKLKYALDAPDLIITELNKEY